MVGLVLASLALSVAMITVLAGWGGGLLTVLVALGMVSALVWGAHPPPADDDMPDRRGRPA